MSHAFAGFGSKADTRPVGPTAAAATNVWCPTFSRWANLERCRSVSPIECAEDRSHGFGGRSPTIDQICDHVLLVDSDTAREEHTFERIGPGFTVSGLDRRTASANHGTGTLANLLRLHAPTRSLALDSEPGTRCVELVHRPPPTSTCLIVSAMIRTSVANDSWRT